MEREKYEIILSELADAIKSKNTDIFLLKCEVSELKKRLEAAEREAAGVKNEDNKHK